MIEHALPLLSRKHIEFVFGNSFALSIVNDFEWLTRNCDFTNSGDILLRGVIDVAIWDIKNDQTKVQGVSRTGGSETNPSDQENLRHLANRRSHDGFVYRERGIQKPILPAQDSSSDKRRRIVFEVFVLFDMLVALFYVRSVMRKKPLKKSKTKLTKRSLPATETPSAPLRASVATEVRVVQLEMPPPDALLREAEEEPNYRDLSEYCPVIATLRNKGFSYREIAEWLSERGVELDHNAVYRLYTREMSDSEAHRADEEADLEAQLEAQRNR